jgi:rod shape-determining protein MreD
MRVTLDRDSHTEVYRFSLWALCGVALLSVVLQAFLHKFTARADYLELPLLVTIYFGVSRRNPSTGLLLGMAIGLAQDGLSHQPIGLFGLAKTCIGYLSSALGTRFEVEVPIVRFGFVWAFFFVHQAILATTERLLLQLHAPYFDREIFIASLINAVLGAILFPLLDKLRKSV